MTKPNPYNTCRFCKKTFKKFFSKQVICSALCAFWSRVEKTDSCWNWIGSTHVSGYGEFRFNRKFFRAHRFSYEIHKGPIGENHILHCCDNERCVNPSHLIAGSHSENMRHIAERDRSGNLKIRREQVFDIRKRLKKGETQTSIAKSFGVTPGCINHIHLRKNRNIN